jgi:hypothetical protein
MSDSFYHVDDDGGITPEQDFSHLGDYQGGQLYYDDGQSVYGVNEPDDLSHLADTQHDDGDLHMSPEEEMLFTHFLDTNQGDFAGAIREFIDYEDQVAGMLEVQQDAGPSEQDVEQWLLEHPAVTAAGIDEFAPFFAKTGDLDQAYELFSHSLGHLREAAAKEGYQVGPKLGMADAIDSAYSDGLLGGKQPYKHVHRGYDTSLDDALGSFWEETSMRNAVQDLSRAKIRALRRSA